MNVTSEQLLTELDNERRKFTGANSLKMLDLCAELEARGVYTRTPTMNEYGYSIYKMVEGYGAYWHTFQGPQECPSCKVDFCDRVNGAPFKREIGIIENDRLSHYKCPECNATL